MSGQQGNQRLRRNGSPSTKQGPIRATQQFGLASPSRIQIRRSPTSSPSPKDNLNNAKNRSRPLSETGLLNGRRSPSSPCGFRIVEKSGAIISGRSNSFDNVMAAPYLSGQWPKDGQWQQQQKDLSSHFISTFISDKQTQTPEEWEEAADRRRSTKLGKSRSQSVGNGDQQLKNIKHKLQRNGGLPATSTTFQQRLSPVFAASPCFQTNAVASSSSTSMPIKIPVSTPSSNGIFTAPSGTPGKARGSVEGFNQEVEKLIRAGGALELSELSLADNLDGHRAPVFELLSHNTRSIDTQTPSHVIGADSYSNTLSIMLEVSDVGERSSSQGSDNSHCSSRDDDEESSQSVSPSFIPGQFELEDSALSEQNDIDGLPSKMSNSPRPNGEFVRQPPDGAEKIKIIDELTVVPRRYTEFGHLTPSKTFQPSATSAFQYLPVYRQSISLAHAKVVDDAH